MNGYNKDLDLTVRTLVCFEHALNTRYPHVSNACPDINRGESLDPTSTPHAWLKEKILKNQNKVEEVPSLQAFRKFKAIAVAEREQMTKRTYGASS